MDILRRRMLPRHRQEGSSCDGSSLQATVRYERHISASSESLWDLVNNFNPESSHVIPAIIRKFVDAIENDLKQVVVWGTGKASREFLYVEDAAEGIIAAAEKYDKPAPVNLSAGKEITIKELVDLVAELTGFKGEIVWDTSKPDGQPGRCLDTSRAREEFGFEAKTNFVEGLQQTINWYRKQVDNKN